MPNSTARKPWQRYSVAIGASVLALGAAWSLRAFGESSIPPIFLATVVFSTWFGGMGPGLLATGLAVLAVDYYFEVPINSLAITSVDTFLDLIVFVGVAFLISMLMDHLRQAEQMAAAAKADAERSRSELSQLLGRMADGVFGLDLNDNALIVYMNRPAAQILLQGTPAVNEDLIGRPIRDVLHPEIGPPFETAYQQARSARVPARFQIQVSSQ